MFLGVAGRSRCFVIVDIIFPSTFQLIGVTLPDFIRGGPGYKSVYYGINNTDPYIQKEHTELFKILKGNLN